MPDGGVDHPAEPVRRLHQGGGNRPPARHQDEHDPGDRVLQAGHEAAGVGGQEPAGVAHHHHPPVGDERGRGQGVDHDPDVEVGGTRTAVLLHHGGRVSCADEASEQIVDGLADQGGVVPPHQVDGAVAVGGLVGRATVRPPPSRR